MFHVHVVHYSCPIVFLWLAFPQIREVVDAEARLKMLREKIEANKMRQQQQQSHAVAASFVTRAPAQPRATPSQQCKTADEQPTPKPARPSAETQAKARATSKKSKRSSTAGSRSNGSGSPTLAATGDDFWEEPVVVGPAKPLPTVPETPVMNKKVTNKVKGFLVSCWGLLWSYFFVLKMVDLTY